MTKRPYRLGAALLGGVLLSCLLLATSGGGRSGGGGDGAVPSVAPDPPAGQGGYAADRANPPPVPVAVPPAAGVVPDVERLRIGSFDKPAASVHVRAGVPAGVPLNAESSALRGARNARTLLVRRVGASVFSAVGVTWRGGTDLPGAQPRPGKRSAAVPAEEKINVAVRGHVPQRGWTAWKVAGTAPADRDSAGVAAQSTRPGEAKRDPATDRRNVEPVWRAGSDLIWLGPVDGAEVLVTGVRGRGVADIVVDLIDPRTAPGDAAASAVAPTVVDGSGGGLPSPGSVGSGAAVPPGSVGSGAAVPPGSVASGAAVPPGSTGDGSTTRLQMPAIARRAEWGADERLMTWSPTYAGPVKAVAWHHTVTSNTYAPGDVPRILRAIYYHQAVARGWGDIGYSVVVDRFGRLWEGRYGGLSRPVVGAHAGGFNRYTAGVAVLGDHRVTPVAPVAVESAAKYIAWKLSLGPAIDPRGSVRLTGGGSTSRHLPNTSITVPRVFPHGLTNLTECPGASGTQVLATLRERAYRLMGALAEPATLRVRLAVWRPADANWHIYGDDPADRARLSGLSGLSGTVGDLPVPADYDGDGTTDLATWSPPSGGWRIAHSAGGTVERVTLGADGDQPVPADYTGDGLAEPAVWRPTDGFWHFASGPPVQWGAAGDIPVPADYTGDGSADIAVWRPSTGTWHVRGVGTYRLGEAYHIPVPADYDGDGDVEPASWSPATQRWFIWGAPAAKFGEPGDRPVPGQYDGDGRADLAVWRPPAEDGAEGSWRIGNVGAYGFGWTGDVPFPLA